MCAGSGLPTRRKWLGDVYEREIEQPIAACLKAGRLTEKVLYIVTTLGVPLKIPGSGSGPTSESASVDSELTLLYRKMKGAKVARTGNIPNPFFNRRDQPFAHPAFDIYLVTRLAAYDVAGVKAMIDRSLRARNTGKFVIDMNSPEDKGGNSWLRTAAILLPADRVIMEETASVLYDRKDVIGYASWGSNDAGRKRRKLGFQWLPGAIVTEFVSTNGRTFRRPPDTWNIGASWSDRANQWAGSPQSLSADYIEEGATGCSGHVYEPYLQFCPRTRKRPAGVLQRIQPGAELLPGHTGAELAEHRAGRSAVHARQAVARQNGRRG